VCILTEIPTTQKNSQPIWLISFRKIIRLLLHRKRAILILIYDLFSSVLSRFQCLILYCDGGLRKVVNKLTKFRVATPHILLPYVITIFQHINSGPKVGTTFNERLVMFDESTNSATKRRISNDPTHSLT